MYAAYNYTPGDFFNSKVYPKYLNIGSHLYDNNIIDIQDCLSDYINPDGAIDGSKLQNHWFKAVDADVFISHSHKDLNKVKAFAGWLHDELGLETFIDSCVWKYCDDLLREIDDQYCYSPNHRSYDYKLRNYTTSHVHMMLSVALVDMLNRTECVLFFNAPNSIVLSDEIASLQKSSKSKTTSPWIFYELTMISRIRRSKPNREQSVLCHSELGYRNQLRIHYDVTRTINEIAQLEDHQLKGWSEKHNPYLNALDELYDITGLLRNDAD